MSCNPKKTAINGTYGFIDTNIPGTWNILELINTRIYKQFFEMTFMWKDGK